MKRISLLLLASILLMACKNSTTENGDTEGTKTDSVAVEKTTENIQPEDLIQEKDINQLNEAQKQVQLLLESCVDKNYTTAGETIMYRGADEKRMGNDNFDVNNAKELGTVKTTCDVLTEWLGASKDYEFVSYKADTIGTEIQYEVEVMFKNKKLGMNRHFFYYKKTGAGLLLFNML